MLKKYSIDNGKLQGRPYLLWRTRDLLLHQVRGSVSKMGLARAYDDEHAGTYLPSQR
jgi:hypothetical protein